MTEINLNPYELFNQGIMVSKSIPKGQIMELINFIKLNKTKKSIISADCQSSSQFGNILKFNKIDIIKPTEDRKSVV